MTSVPGLVPAKPFEASREPQPDSAERRGGHPHSQHEPACHESRRPPAAQALPREPGVEPVQKLGKLRAHADLEQANRNIDQPADKKSDRQLADRFRIREINPADEVGHPPGDDLVHRPRERIVHVDVLRHVRAERTEAPHEHRHVEPMAAGTTAGCRCRRSWPPAESPRRSPPSWNSRGCPEAEKWPPAKTASPRGTR